MIGIKIADGSFYPILEEGKPGEKKLEVTTVRDDQTTVQINLYKSESGSMDDADYVDTLLIDNLVPHHKEEPSFDLLVKIDENNMLSAEIDDPETGGKSDTKVSLVNMGNKSIFDEPDYKVSTDDMPAAELPPEIDIPTETIAETPAVSDVTEIQEEPQQDALVEEDNTEFSLADSLSDIPDLDDSQLTASADDFSLSDFDSLDVPSGEALQVAEEAAAGSDFTASELPEEPLTEEPTTEAVSEDAPAASDDFSFDLSEESQEPAISEPATSDDFSFDLPEEPVTEAVSEDTPVVSDDFSFNMPEEPLTEAVSEDTPAASDDFSFNMPEEPVTEELVTEEPVAESVLTDEDFSFSTDFSDDEKDVDDDEKPFSFDSLPDFDEIPELAESSGDSESLMDDDLDIDFSIPEDNDMNKNNYNNTYDNVSESQPDYSYAPSSNMQSALFGGDDLFEETKKQKERKAFIPVIICILCALISLGVLGVILYLTPSIMKLAGGMQSEQTAVVSTAVSDTDSIAAEEEIIVEEPTIRKAEENKIVVLNETVPPVVPETKKEQTEISSIIKHLVKWGDTLWDLAGFYYRNPWLYRIISDANNLENPDLIISGTYLTIPDR